MVTLNVSRRYVTAIKQKLKIHNAIEERLKKGVQKNKKGS